MRLQDQFEIVATAGRSRRPPDKLADDLVLAISKTSTTGASRRITTTNVSPHTRYRGAGDITTVLH